jgi:hypothetical protein
MDEKCILGSKAQSMGEAKERVFDDGNRRAGTKGKRSKGPAKAMVVKKEASVPKPMRKMAEVPEMPPMKAMPPEVSAEMPSVKAMPPEVSPEVPTMATSVPAKMPAVTASTPIKSLNMSCRCKANKASRDTNNDKPFHIPLLYYTRGDSPWRFEVEQPLPQPPACFHPSL